jgi:hypothetical protein
MLGNNEKDLESKHIRSTQLKLYKVMTMPVLNYKCENWAVNGSDERKFESAEVKFVRSMAGFTLLDFKRNAEIRNHSNMYV